MHDKWQEQLSFYVAGSLPPDEARALEQHLAGCADCRQALREWRTISDAVRAEATVWSRGLPPLSAEVRAALPRTRPAATLVPTGRTTPVAARSPRIVRHSHGPLTVLAAMLTVVLLGGLLLFVTNRDEEQPATEVALASTGSATEVTREATATGQPTLMVPTQQDLGILVPAATSVPPTTVVPSRIPPTATPQPPQRTPVPQTTLQPPAQLSTLPFGSGGGVGGADMLLEPDVCHVATMDGGIVTLYAQPSRQSAVVGTIGPNRNLRTYVQSNNGWVQIVEIGPGILGWAPMAALTFSGSCTELPLPTATWVDFPVIDADYPSTPTPTPTDVAGRITMLTTSATSVQRGGNVTVYWTTENTAMVWVEYFGVDMTSGISSPAPLGQMPLASPSGQWTVAVPADFAYTGLRFVIIVDNYDNGLGIPRAETVVSVTP